ncbi:S8 family serine peptidase [Candidatus Falkowbacteria bacterium]|nr:S8 family serine peptidase [Candidatus Falkowbacteria bacterium]
MLSALALSGHDSIASPSIPASLLVKYRGEDAIKEVRVPDQSHSDEFIMVLKQDPNIEWAEPDYSFHSAIIPSDTHYSQQWYLQKIKAPSAWDITQSTKNIVTAVIDTGVDITHPDLKNNIWINQDEIPGNRKDDDNNGFIDDINGWDFVGRNADPMPKFEEGFTSDVLHGTIISGLIAAEGNNAAGVSGVTWNARIMPLRVLNDKGEGTAGNVIRAIDYAINNGAHVINLSFIGFNYSQGMDEAIRRAYEAGVIVVAAAGNEAGDQTKDTDLNKTPMYPVCLDGRPGENRVIGVAATDAMDQKTYFSGYGSRCVDITGPGVSIFNLSVYAPDKTLDNQPLNKYYDGYWSGTSVAAPQVSGVLALIMSTNPGLDRKATVDVLLSSATNITRLNPLYPNQLGSGRVSAAGAVELAKDRLTENKFDLIVNQSSGTSTVLNIINPARSYNKEIVLGAELAGGVNVASGDVDGDGRAEIIVGAGPGGGPHVKILDQTGRLKGQFMAYNTSFRGGVNVASGDVDGDGRAEIIVGAGPGGGPHVKIINGRGQLKGQFMAYKTSFRGGVNVAVADVDGGTINRRSEIVTSPGAGMPAEIRIFTDHAKLLSKFSPFAVNFDKGVNLTSADTNQDGLAEIIVGAGPGGGPHVRVFTSAGKLVDSFYAYPSEIKTGVRITSIKSQR